MMEPALVLLVTAFFGVSIYLLLSRHVIRMLLGVALLSNAVNLLIFTAGRLTREVPPIIAENSRVPESVTANPLPQALILTAIVISFSFFAFLLVLSYRTYQDLGTDDTNDMRLAEPETDLPPPQGY
jgi:multicomponent Na+:H+ antiporter subunit C